MRRRLFLLFLALFLPMWSGELAGQTATPVELTSQGSTEIPFVFHHGTFGLWSGSALLVVQDRFSRGPAIRVIERDGEETSRFTFTIPEDAFIRMYDRSIARGMDRSLAVIGTVDAYPNDSRGASFLAWVSPDGQEQTLMRLSPFLPAAVTVGSDGTIWVAGHETWPFGGPRDYAQHLIRRYDRTGKLLGSFIPWSSLGTIPYSPPPDRTHPPDTESVLVSLADRIGWYSRHSQTYVELSLDGEVINWIKTPEHPRHVMLSVALCDDGGLFVGAAVLNGPNRTASWGIYALDRQRGEWSFLPRPEKWGMLYGCDGTRLASTTDSRNISWLEPTGK